MIAYKSFILPLQSYYRYGLLKSSICPVACCFMYSNQLLSHLNSDLVLFWIGIGVRI